MSTEQKNIIMKAIMEKAGTKTPAGAITFSLPVTSTAGLRMIPKDEMDNLLYQHTYYQDNITISSIPLYHLEPNTRITVTDEKSGIYGDYLVKSFSIPLAHDGMMSITASRAEQRII